MSDTALHCLAQRAGIAVHWRDFRGQPQEVSAQTLGGILTALELPCATLGQIAESRQSLEDEARSAPPPLVTAVCGQPIALPHISSGDALAVTLETGERLDLRPGASDALPPIAQPGYHRLHLGDDEITLAVAPASAYGVEDLAPSRRLWGLSAQLYGLRRSGDGGIGDFTALTGLVQRAAAAGAAALAISPVHAWFAADVGRYSPYSPSSRLFLNSLHADPAALAGASAARAAAYALHLSEELARFEALPLIDWPAAATARLRLQRELYQRHAAASAEELRAFRRERGPALEDHARFEALHAHQLAHRGRWHWREWPAPLRDPGSATVCEFAGAHRDEVDFHIYLQWLAERGLAGAQQAAREVGMRIGLIADLAVGTDRGGSHAWSRQQDLLSGLSVGAPPDDLNLQGQSWGLTTFSPRALRLHGYAPFLEMLLAALRHAGGLRIDHVLGLNRLWLVPEGASASEGAYLQYPLQDLLRLIALESHRHRAVVIGEDLGTVPDGLRERLSASGVLGMRVLWFQREHGLFVEPTRWPRGAMATTTTHDLPTVAGWWQERDIDWRLKIGELSADQASGQRGDRARDRDALLHAFGHAGLPAAADPDAVVDSAVRFVARTSSALAIVPLEDIAGVAEQPNLPGTVDQHPNWRRRLPQAVEPLLASEPAVRRLASLREERGG